MEKELKFLYSDKDIYNDPVYLLSLPPLFLAISKCMHSASELLLEYGACPNIQDLLGNTPLHIACAKSKSCETCIFLLLKYHASSVVMNNIEHTPETILDYLKSPISIQNIRFLLIDDIFTNNLNPNINNKAASIKQHALSNASSLTNGRLSIITYFQDNSQNSLTNTIISSNSIRNIFSKKHKSVSTVDAHLGMSCNNNNNNNNNSRKVSRQQSAVSEVTNTLPKSRRRKKHSMNTISNPTINKVSSVHKLLAVANTDSGDKNNIKGKLKSTLKKSLSSQSAACNSSKIMPKNSVVENFKKQQNIMSDAFSSTTNYSSTARKSLNKSTFSSTNYQSIETRNEATSSSLSSSKLSIFKKLVSVNLILRHSIILK